MKHSLSYDPPFENNKSDNLDILDILDKAILDEDTIEIISTYIGSDDVYVYDRLIHLINTHVNGHKVNKIHLYETCFNGEVDAAKLFKIHSLTELQIDSDIFPTNEEQLEEFCDSIKQNKTLNKLRIIWNMDYEDDNMHYCYLLLNAIKESNIETLDMFFDQDIDHKVLKELCSNTKLKKIHITGGLWDELDEYPNKIISSLKLLNNNRNLEQIEFSEWNIEENILKKLPKKLLQKIKYQ